MIHIKPGVVLHRLQPQIVLAAHVVDEIYQRHDIIECWLTAGSDGKHKPNSKHYSGEALDFRTHNVPAQLRTVIATDVAKTLIGRVFDGRHGRVKMIYQSPGNPTLYDVVLHKTHMHVEYDVKEQS
jgi:hypothetical protein